MGSFSVNLAGLTPNAWNRVWIDSGYFTTDGNQLPAGRPTLILENGDTTAIQFVAWGFDMTQVGGPRYLPSGFDPGFKMYDSLSQSDYADVLQLAPITASNAGTGFCLSVDVEPSPGLSWDPGTTAFDDVRAMTEWWNGQTGAAEQSARIVIGGDPSHSAGQGAITFRVTTAGDTNYVWAVRFPPVTWNTGPHNIKGCLTPAGEYQVYGDNVLIPGTATNLPAGAVVPDLATGHLSLGNDHTGGIPWFGWVSKGLACPFSGAPGDLTHCN
jgi:hypothetical protein